MLPISWTVVVMVDVADRWMCGRLDLEVLKCLSQHPDTPAILVLNKVFLDQWSGKNAIITAKNHSYMSTFTDALFFLGR